MKYFYFLILFLASSLNAQETVLNMITDLSLVETRKQGNYKNWEAGFRSFYVTKNEYNQIEIKEPPLKHVSKYPPHMSCGDIHYHGTDKGEWIGELTAEDENGNQRTVVKGNVYHLVNWEGTLYIFIGVQHMRYAGAVYKLSACDTMSAKVELVTLLPDAPIDLLMEPRPSFAGFYIFGNEMILYLAPEFSISVEVYNPWKGIRPTSVVGISDYQFLVGLVSGIAIVDLQKPRGQEVRVFVPKDNAHIN